MNTPLSPDPNHAPDPAPSPQPTASATPAATPSATSVIANAAITPSAAEGANTRRHKNSGTLWAQALQQRLAQVKMPSAEQLAQSPWLKPFARHLQQSNFWQWQAANVSRAVGIGLFWAWQPLPLQMVGAVWFAIWLRAHIGLAVAMVWVNNPFTLGFIFYGNYAVGVWLCNFWQPTPMLSLTELNWTVMPPLLLGSLVVGLGLGLLSSLIVQYGWRLFKPGV